MELEETGSGTEGDNDENGFWRISECKMSS